MNLNTLIRRAAKADFKRRYPDVKTFTSTMYDRGIMVGNIKTHAVYKIIRKQDVCPCCYENVVKIETDIAVNDGENYVLLDYRGGRENGGAV